MLIFKILLNVLLFNVYFKVRILISVSESEMKAFENKSTSQAEDSDPIQTQDSTPQRKNALRVKCRKCDSVSYLIPKQGSDSIDVRKLISNHAWSHVHDLDPQIFAIFTCDICDFRCKTEQVVRNHLNTIHAKLKKKTYADHREDFRSVYFQQWTECFPDFDEHETLRRYRLPIVFKYVLFLKKSSFSCFNRIFFYLRPEHKFCLQQSSDIKFEEGFSLILVGGLGGEMLKMAPSRVKIASLPILSGIKIPIKKERKKNLSKKDHLVLML